MQFYIFCGWLGVLWAVALRYLYFENHMLSSPCLAIDNLIPLGWFVKMMTRCAVKKKKKKHSCHWLWASRDVLSNTMPSAVSFRMEWAVEEIQHSKRLTVVGLYLLPIPLLSFFPPILQPFGKIPANVVTEASIHNLMSSGVLFILIFHISQRPRPWVEILMWGWVWKKNMPRKTSENPEALLHAHKERIGWPRLGGVCSNPQTAWQQKKKAKKYVLGLFRFFVFKMLQKLRVTFRTLETFK